jgi:CheY-like chemotaxis protein
MRQVRVLYVEDDLMLRGLVAGRITERIAELEPELDLSWELAATLEEGLADLGLLPDVILTELALRGGGKHAGLRVLERARARGLWVPVFMLGEWVDCEVACEAQLLHAHVVPKGGSLAVEALAKLFVQCLRSPYDRVAPILAATREPLDDKMEATQAAIVHHTLCQCGGNRSAAARALGITRQNSRLRVEAPPRQEVGQFDRKK